MKYQQRTFAAGCAVAFFCACIGTALAADPPLGNEPQQQMDFWHALVTVRAVTNDQAFHAVLLLLEGSDAAGSYEQRVAQLKQRGLLKGSFDDGAGEFLRRGVLAHILAKALQIKGGVVMRALGSNERYALRELMDMGIFPFSSPQQALSGSEFVAVIGRADDHQRSQSRKPSRMNQQIAGAQPAFRATPALAAVSGNAVSFSFAFHGLSINPYQEQTTYDTPLLAQLLGNEFAQAGQPPPAGQANGLKAKVVAVRGAAQARTAEAQPWQAVAVGQEYGADAEFRTGVRSAVRFRIEPGRDVVLDRLGVIKLVALAGQPGGSSVNLGSTYGKGQLSVEKAGKEHETTVSSPGLTLAVRGTVAGWQNQGSFRWVYGADGQVRVADDRLNRPIVMAGPGTQAVTGYGQAPAQYAYGEAAEDVPDDFDLDKAREDLESEDYLKEKLRQVNELRDGFRGHDLRRLRSLQQDTGGGRLFGVTNGFADFIGNFELAQSSPLALSNMVFTVVTPSGDRIGPAGMAGNLDDNPSNGVFIHTGNGFISANNPSAQQQVRSNSSQLPGLTEFGVYMLEVTNNVLNSSPTEVIVRLNAHGFTDPGTVPPGTPAKNYQIISNDPAINPDQFTLPGGQTESFKVVVPEKTP